MAKSVFKLHSLKNFFEMFFFVLLHLIGKLSLKKSRQKILEKKSWPKNKQKHWKATFLFAAVVVVVVAAVVAAVVVVDVVASSKC